MGVFLSSTANGLAGARESTRLRAPCTVHGILAFIEAS
jgi:hypothetical protein